MTIDDAALDHIERDLCVLHGDLGEPMVEDRPDTLLSAIAAIRELRARLADKEQEAWDRFAAVEQSKFPHERPSHGEPTPRFFDKMARHCGAAADAMMAEHRKRMEKADD